MSARGQTKHWKSQPPERQKAVNRQHMRDFWKAVNEGMDAVMDDTDLQDAIARDNEKMLRASRRKTRP